MFSMKNKKRLLLSAMCCVSALATVWVLLFTTSYAVPPATAQTRNPIDLAVSPPVTYLQVKPGESATYQVRVEQQGTLPVYITPSFVDFESNGQTGQPELKQNSNFRFLTIDVPSTNIENNRFRLQPNSSKNVNITISPPLDAMEQEYPLSIFFNATPDNSGLIGSGSDIQASVASNLVVFISGETSNRAELEVKNIRTWQVIDSLMPITFQILAENSGVHAGAAAGSASITNWQGKTVAQFSFYPDMILADSSRLLRTSPELNLSSNLQELDAEALEEIDLDLLTTEFLAKEPFLLGVYEIEIQLRTKELEDSQEVITTTKKILAFPFSLILVGILIPTSWFSFKFLSSKHEVPLR